MLSKAEVTVRSDIRTKRSTQSEHHVEFLNIKPWWYVKKPLGFKRLTYDGFLKRWDTPHILVIRKDGVGICLHITEGH